MDGRGDLFLPFLTPPRAKKCFNQRFPRQTPHSVVGHLYMTSAMGRRTSQKPQVRSNGVLELYAFLDGHLMCT